MKRDIQVLPTVLDGVAKRSRNRFGDAFCHRRANAAEILWVMPTSVYIPNTDRCFFIIVVFSF